MCNVQITDNQILIDGHAENKIVCAMLTALTVSFVDNMINVHASEDDLHVILDRGKFNINVSCVVDGTPAETTLQNYIRSIHKLAETYPNSFDMHNASRYYIV